jgi:FkbM family methyltransferase
VRHTPYDLIKRLTLNHLPDRILQAVKKIHYAKVLSRAMLDDEPDLRVVQFLLEPGQCVADIGANIGVYAKHLSQCVGPSGRVISVEPIPFTFDILRSNLRKLGLRNVEAKNCAISDLQGQVRMQVPKYDSGGENFYEARVGEGEASNAVRSFVLPATTLDGLLSTWPFVHFIKCDVEGHELNCIRGARKTIDRCKPSWLIEISGDMDDERSSSYQTRRILRDSGYDAYWFDGSTLRPQRPSTKSVNYFFLTASQVESLRQKGLPLER